MATHGKISFIWSDNDAQSYDLPGTYTSKQPVGVAHVDRTTGELINADGEIIKTGLERRERNGHDYYVNDNYRGDPDETRYLAQDYARAQNYGRTWNYMYCQAVVTVTFASELGERTEQMTSPGLGGIESDLDTSERVAIELEQKADLLAQLAELKIEAAQ